MLIVKIDSLSVEIAGKTLFEDVSLEIIENERVALIGENGIGKTTLLKTILKKVPFKTGQISYGIQIDEIGYMVQDNELDDSLTVRETVEWSHPNTKLKRKLNEYTSLLENHPSNKELIENYNHILQLYLDANGYDWEIEVEKSLKHVGLPEDLWNHPFSHLSGGQKTRAKLAQVMLKNPKLLILDEPTNHLDIESIYWLEKWLVNYSGSILFISHEREFIDHVATITVELTEEGTKKYMGGYSSYRTQKEHELKSLQKQYKKQELERKKLVETIQQYKQWYDKANSSASVRNPYAQKKAAKQANKYKAKEKALERLEQNKVKKPNEPKTIATSIIAADFTGRKLLELDDLMLSYGTKTVLKNVYLQISRGDRIAVVGKNGSGKTTLLKLLTGVLNPDFGTVRYNPQLKIGYFFQELENLKLDRTILEEIMAIPNMNQSDARTILACFLFRKDDVFKKIKDLSMGEKCRVAFVKLYFSDANLLVLDEPTNYFDIPTRETIEEALQAYPGAIVIVAHDPYLLRKVANKVIHIENGTVTNYSGSYREWEKHSTIPSEKQDLYNQLEALELQYLQLITEEVEYNHLEEIMLLKEKINELKQKIKL